MPRDLDTEDLDSRSGPAVAHERVSSGGTRPSRISWECRMVLIILPAVAALIWSRTSGSASPPRESVPDAALPRKVESIAFSPDGRMLAASGIDRNVHLWDARRWNEGRLSEPAILAHDAAVSAMAFSPDGRTLATAAGRSFAIWTRDPSYRRQFERTGDSYHALAFSPDGDSLALGSEDGTIQLWEMPVAAERRRIRGHGGPVKTVAFSPDGKLLASGGEEGRVVLWDAIKGTEVRVLIEGGPEPIQAVAFSPDGRAVGVAVPCSEAMAVILFDAGTGAIRKQLFGHPRGTLALAFSPDGRSLATVGIDRSIKLWDLVRVANEPAVVSEGLQPTSVAFSPDGRWLAYTGGAGEVRLVATSKFRPDRADLPDQARREEPQPAEAQDVLMALPGPLESS